MMFLVYFIQNDIIIRRIAMSTRTDLAVEVIKSADGRLPSGVQSTERTAGSFKVTEINVGEEGAAAIGKPAGRYVTVETPPLSNAVTGQEEQAEALAQEIAALADVKGGTALIVGLGNNDITPDALGPKVIGRILATRHLSDELPKGSPLAELKPVAALATGVLGQTGIESAEIVKAVCQRIKPSAVIVIDALACSDVSRLGRTIQMSDSGISPGSGVQNRRRELSEATTGVPVIAIGVPTVIDMHTVAEGLTGRPADSRLPNMMVTPRDIDNLITGAARLISLAINKAFQPALTLEEILSLSA